MSLQRGYVPMWSQSKLEITTELQIDYHPFKIMIEPTKAHNHLAIPISVDFHTHPFLQGLPPQFRTYHAASFSVRLRRRIKQHIRLWGSRLRCDETAVVDFIWLSMTLISLSAGGWFIDQTLDMFPSYAWLFLGVFYLPYENETPELNTSRPHVIDVRVVRAIRESSHVTISNLFIFK